jgi:hypothetical protein
MRRGPSRLTKWDARQISRATFGTAAFGADGALRQVGGPFSRRFEVDAPVGGLRC